MRGAEEGTAHSRPFGLDGCLLLDDGVREFDVLLWAGSGDFLRKGTGQRRWAAAVVHEYPRDLVGREAQREQGRRVWLGVSSMVPTSSSRAPGRRGD